MTLDRLITTDLSGNIVAALLKRGWTVQQLAETIDAPIDFVQRVQGRTQVFTLKDIRALAKRSGQSPQLMLLDSVNQIKPDLQPLFDATRRLLQSSAAGAPQTAQTRTRKRANRKTAA